MESPLGFPVGVPRCRNGGPGMGRLPKSDRGECSPSRPAMGYALIDRFHETIRSDGGKFKPTDLILRSRVRHGVSKDGRRHDLVRGRPSRRANRNRLLPISTPMEAEVGQPDFGARSSGRGYIDTIRSFRNDIPLKKGVHIASAPRVQSLARHRSRYRRRPGPSTPGGAGRGSLTRQS
jgi:hypothetical protein